MVSDNDISTLVDMGFTRDQAIEALKATGNDINNAIAHLFGEVPQPPPAAPESAIPSHTLGTVQLTNPQDVPEILGQFASSGSAENAYYNEYPSHDQRRYSDEWDANETTIKGSGDIDTNYTENQTRSSGTSSQAASILMESLDSDSSFTLPMNARAENQPFPMIVTKEQTHKCWAPLLSILGIYPPFVKGVLESEADSDVAKELQRLVYFISNYEQSKRMYIDASSITSLLPSKPNFQYMDEEVVVHMLQELMQTIPELNPVLGSHIESEDDDVSKELVVLEIDSDSRYPTLYQTLNEMFWQKDYSLLGCVKYSSVAPVVTIQLLCDEDAYTTAFELQEIFYPEIYSSKCVSLVKGQIESIVEAQTAQHALARKLINYNFFEGKKVDDLLEVAKEALKGTVNASDDVLALMSQLDDARASELKKQAAYKEEASPEHLRLFDKIIASSPGLRAFVLIGVIISESRFFIRAKNQWIQMEDCETIDFEDVQDVVRHVSRKGPHVITLVYADSSGLGDIQFVEETQKSKQEETQPKSASSDLIDLLSESGSAGVQSPDHTDEAKEDVPDKDNAENSKENENYCETANTKKITIDRELAKKFLAEEKDVSLGWTEAYPASAT